MTPEKWLSEQIKEKGIKQIFIAEKAGIPGLTDKRLSLTLTGRRKFQVDEFLAVCSVVGVNPLDYPNRKAGETGA